MYHLRLKGKHYQMGVKRGAIFSKAKITFPLHLDEFQIHHGIESEKILKKYFPEICEEIKGVSDTMGMDYSIVASWMLCMGCCMYNLEENIPKEIRGCTAFAYTKENRVLYGRNNELPPYLRDGSKAELYQPKNANAFILTTSSFINGEEGINEHGLSVAMTFVMTQCKNIRPGFNSCFIVRYLLEKADCTNQAMDMLMELPIASNCNILIADKSGNMVVIECTSFKKRVREAIPTKEGHVVCCVNGFSSDEFQQYDESNGDDYHSKERYEVVMKYFMTQHDNSSIEEIEKLLKGEYGFMCQYEEDDFETVWSSVFDLKDCMIYRAEGDPRKKKFIEDKRLHDVINKRK
ncbi:MAG: C45 family peptidase [Longicatena sp.]